MDERVTLGDLIAVVVIALVLALPWFMAAFSAQEISCG